MHIIRGRGPGQDLEQCFTQLCPVMRARPIIGIIGIGIRLSVLFRKSVSVMVMEFTG